MKPQVHVIGLGPGGPDLVTSGALELINSIPTQFLRTERHPASSVMPHAQWFDLLYETANSVEEVYPAIVEALAKSAEVNGEILYAVPGSPIVAEHSVELLLDDDRLSVIVHPALSFLDLTWARLGVDPVQTGVTFVDGHNFAQVAAGLRGPLLVGQCDSRFVLSDIKLAFDEAPEQPVTVLARLGLPDEEVFSVSWDDLDRSFEPDHLTSLWIPELGQSAPSEMRKLMDQLAEAKRGADVDDTFPGGVDQTSAARLLAGSVAVGESIHDYDATTGENVEDLADRLGVLLLELMTLASELESDGWVSTADLFALARDTLQQRD